MISSRVNRIASRLVSLLPTRMASFFAENDKIFGELLINLALETVIEKIFEHHTIRYGCCLPHPAGAASKRPYDCTNSICFLYR